VATFRWFCRFQNFVEGQRIRFATSLNLLASLPFSSAAELRGRQEVYRVHDRYGLDAILRSEIDRLDAIHYLSNKIRRIHVSRLHLAHRPRAVWLDRQTQHHLALQGWIAAEFPVVIPVESRLVTIKHNLYFFVGA